jgi:hypothetical protein
MRKMMMKKMLVIGAMYICCVIGTCGQISGGFVFGNGYKIGFNPTTSHILALKTKIRCRTPLLVSAVPAAPAYRFALSHVSAMPKP